MSKRARDGTILVGQAGTEYLQELLSTTDAPLEAITEFQAKNGLADMLTLVTELLRLHGMSNAQIHNHLLQGILREILDKIKSFDLKQIESLLQRTYPYLAVPELQKVPLALLAAHPRLPHALLKTLGNMEDVYAVLPLSTKQQIWAINETKFREEAFQLFLSYADIASVNVMCMHAKPAHEPARRRAENPALLDILNAVGHSLDLYTQIIGLIKTYYMDTKMPIFCTLRCELLMSVHDKGISALYQVDDCHRLAWLLDAAVREDGFETRQLKEIESYMKKFEKNQEVWSDLAMVLTDPITSHMLLRNITRILRVIVENEGIPREDPKLALVTQLADLGFKSVAIIEGDEKPGFSKGQDIMNEFYPLLSEVILDDDLREAGEEPEEFDPQLAPFFTSSPLARQVCLLLAIESVERSDVVSYLHWASMFAEDAHIPLLLVESAYIASLVTVLRSHPVGRDNWGSVFTTGILPFVSDADWHGHAIQLLKDMHDDIPHDVAKQILDATEGTVYPEDTTSLQGYYTELRNVYESNEDLLAAVDACLAKCN